MLREMLQDSIRTMQDWLDDADQILIFENLINEVERTFLNGGKLILMGNGGSAAEAAHIAGEFVGKCSAESKPLPAISLSESTVLMTALSNDYGLHEMFTRSLKALANRNDFVIFLSTSGTSKNIAEAMKYVSKAEIGSSLWTSQKFDGKKDSSHFTIVAPTTSTPRAQELHLLLGHTMAQLIEAKFLE